MHRHDWLLMGLASAGKPLTPVQVQKLMFLFQAQVPKAELGETYTFVPYAYGPFDQAIYSDAESLEAEGMMVIDRNTGLRTYALTPAGAAYAAELERKVSPPVVGFLRALVAWMLPLSFAQLVRAVYEKHPDFKINSVFQG